MKAPWQGLCPGAIVYLRLVAEHAHLLLGTDLFDSAAKGCLSLRPAGPASVLWECRGRRGEGVGDRELGAETDRDRQTHGDGDRERNQSYAQTPQPVISFHRRCQADTWSRSARCVAAGPCGQLAGEWKAAPAYLAVLPSVPWPPRPGDLCCSQEGVERRSFSPPPSLPAFSELVFSCRSAVLRRRVHSGFPPVGTGPGGLWWASAELRLAEDLESDPRLAVFSSQWLSQVHTRLCQRPGTSSGPERPGGCGSSAPTASRCGPSPPPRAASPRESL